MKTIKVLSVRQPWAWLICAGYKDVENRSWKTNYRGRLYIHAGKSFDWGAIGFCRLIGEHHAATMIYEYFCPCQGKFTDHLDEFGAIIGYVDLTDCIQNSRSIWAIHGLYHWQLQNANFIDPVPLKGQLRIFEVEKEILGDEK
ncbi:MAG: ASCH domain-containing protein [Lentisphaeria bacterium]|nr:ASCH domain-containing protein [Lentisphaeria bacterium]